MAHSVGASTALIILHNIVTASAGNQFPEGRGGLYAVHKVLQGLPCAFVQDVSHGIPDVDATLSVLGRDAPTLSVLNRDAQSLLGLRPSELRYFVPPAVIRRPQDY